LEALATDSTACHDPSVKTFLYSLFSLTAAALFAGCLTSSIGGPGSVTVPNTNVDALIAAAKDVFVQAGYGPGPASYPTSISFEKAAGRFGQTMWGSFDQRPSIRVRLSMTPVSGTNDFRLNTRVLTVNNSGEAGFEDQRALVGLWSSEFGPLLRKIKTQASGAGPAR
jgi:hypothetical protein